MKITLVNTPNEVEAHATGCKDIEKVVKNGVAFDNNEPWEIEVENRWAAFISYNADFYDEGGMDHCWHVAFKPCTRKLPNGEWPEEFGI